MSSGKAILFRFTNLTGLGIIQISETGENDGKLRFFPHPSAKFEPEETNMKKRILALVLVLALCAGLLVMPVGAAEPI